MTDDTEKRRIIGQQLEGASSERLGSIKAMLSMSDDKADVLGEALSLSAAGYNVAELHGALQRVREQQGVKLVRTRTAVRVFGFQDDDDESVVHRGFYVEIATSEQIGVINQDKANKMKFLVGKGLKFKKSGEVESTPDLSFLQSDEFQAMLADPTKAYRQVVVDNLREIEMDGEKPIKPLKVKDCDASILPETVMSDLEQDLLLLVEQQVFTAKNLPTTDILGI